MSEITNMYEKMGIRPEVLKFGNTIEEDLKERFSEINQRAEYNQLKVLHAMQKNHVSADCFNYVSGYGYDDHGRDTLEKIYADCLPYRKCTGSPTDYLWNTCAGTFSCSEFTPGRRAFGGWRQALRHTGGSNRYPPFQRIACRIWDFLQTGRPSGRWDI